MSFNNKLNIAVIGATGYTGLDLVYYLAKHPKVKILYLCSQLSIGTLFFSEIALSVSRPIIKFPYFNDKGEPMELQEKIKSDIEKFLTDLDNKMPHVNFNIIGPGGVFRFSHYIPYSMEGAAVAKEIFPWT